MYRPKHVAEYVLLRLLVAPLRWLPLRMALGLAWVLAAFIHFVARFRVSAARARIRQVLGEERTAREIRRIAWRSWRNLCFNVVELTRVPSLTVEELRRRVVDVTPLQEVRAACREGKGAVLAVPHAGNWDLAGIGSHLLGVPIFFIARRQKNPLADAYLNRIRNSTGAETILNDTSLLKNVIRKLRRGQVLAILPDVRAPTPALPIEFFGATANIGGGMALFARQTGVPIVPAIVCREGWTRHRWLALDPVHPDPAVDKQEDWRRMTQEVMRQFDRQVRAMPEQYFWYNKRWVLDPLKEEKP